MGSTPTVTAPSEWVVPLQIRQRLWALLEAEALRSGRNAHEILVDVVGDFLRANPVSWR